MYDLAYMWNLKKVEFIETEKEWNSQKQRTECWLPGGGGEKNDDMSVKGINFQLKYE